MIKSITIKFLIISFIFQQLKSQIAYLKLTKMYITRFAMKLFIDYTRNSIHEKYGNHLN